MAAPDVREGHAWANGCIAALAKIHATFDAGSQKIGRFTLDSKITKADTKYDEFNKVGVGDQRDAFDSMIYDEDVVSYRGALEGFSLLYQEILRSLRRNRPRAERFEVGVSDMTDLEQPASGLFKIHDGQFPVSREDLVSLTARCRKIYNTTRHIKDIPSSSKHKNTWNHFFVSIAPLKFSDIVDMFEQMLRVLEYVETGATGIIDTAYLHTQLRKYTDDPLYFAKPDIIKTALGANKWGDYIEVEHKPEFEGEDEETLAILHLDYLTRPGGADYVLEINGEGGLGKTKLAREYILRSIDRELKYRPEAYEYYLYYTAKSEQQGEVTAAIGKAFTESPDDWAVGGGDYIHNLSFDRFIDVACRTFDLPTSDAKENLLEFLKEREVLILLDNFEDVGNRDIAKYRKFFRGIEAGTKSRILITSRKEPTYGRADIELSRFNRQKAVEMLHKRYVFEVRNEKTTYRMRLLNELRDIDQSKQDIVEDIINGVVIPEDRGAGVEALERNLTHPLYLRLLANILANPKVIETADSDSSLVSIIIDIIDDPDYGFWEWHDNVVRWMLKHAYNKIEDNEHCMALLNLLQQHPNGVDKGQIHADFRDRFPDEQQLLTKIEASLKELNDYGGFLEDNVDSDRYILTNNARKFLLEIVGLAAPEQGREDRQEQDGTDTVDYVKELMKFKEKGVHKWGDIEQVIAILKHYMKSTQAYNEPLFKELESMCFEYANQDSPGRDDLGVFLELLRVIQQGELRAKLLVRNSSTLADDEVFTSLSEDVQFLANVVMDDAKSSPDMIEKTAVSAHAGAVLMLLMKMLNHGIQGDIHLVFDLLNAVLSQQSEDNICEIVEQYDYTEEFGLFMMKRAQQIEWSIKTQNLYDLHAPEEAASSVSKRTRFSYIKPTEVEDHWTVEFHEEGEQTFDQPGQKGFTVNWDLITSTICVYVLPNREQQKPAQNLEPLNHEEGFVEWTQGGRRNQPGLSVDPVIMASDMAITIELYQETTFVNPEGFSRAEKFKKLYKQIYKGPVSAQSMSFILAYRLPNDRPVRPQDLGNQLEVEFDRRLNMYHEGVEVNTYYSTADMPAWKQQFRNVIQQAIQLLETGDPRVKQEIERRKSKTSEIIRPHSDATMRGIIKNQQRTTKKPLSRSDFVLPAAIQQVLKTLQQRPLIRRSAFKDLMAKHGGSLHQTLKDERKFFENGTLKEWQLHEKWIDSSTSVIWNLSDALVKTYDYSEELVKSIESYHHKRYAA